MMYKRNSIYSKYNLMIFQHQLSMNIKLEAETIKSNKMIKSQKKTQNLLKDE